MSTTKVLAGVIANINRLDGVSDASYRTLLALNVAFALSRSLDKQAALEQFAASWDQYHDMAKDMLGGVHGSIN